MDFYFNELSIHGQFSDVHSFSDSFKKHFKMTELCKMLGYSVFYADLFSIDIYVTSQLNLKESIHRMNRDMQNLFFLMIGKNKPFMETKFQEYYLTYNDNDIIGSFLAEAAMRIKNDEEDCRMISLVPSNWKDENFIVIWHQDDDYRHEISITNYTDISIINTLAQKEHTFHSWKDLHQHCLQYFKLLLFSDKTFDPILNTPFNRSVARELQRRLAVLDKLCHHKDKEGFTKEGLELYNKYFIGDKAWFSSSSDSEKNEFKEKLTFKNPENSQKKEFCPLHGKIKTPQTRIHFSWLESSAKKCFVAYIGPKITKK